MNDSPVLITAFNRPTQTKALIDSLRELEPRNVIFAVDGPRADKPQDKDKVQQTQDLVNSINWKCNVETIFRPINLGLQIAVVDAVSQVTDKFGKVIVVEDDVVVGRHFLQYMDGALNRHRSDETIAHVNGYVVVPRAYLTRTTMERKTQYIESFAWATWEKSWSKYDPSLDWARNVTIYDLTQLIGSRVSAIRWKQIFNDALHERIDTWAYRWMATIWSNKLCAVSPPFNLVEYHGWNDGTHTMRRARWQEQPVSEDPENHKILDNADPIQFDLKVDKWLGETVFGESLRGISEGALTSVVLQLRKFLAAIKSNI